MFSAYFRTINDTLEILECQRDPCKIQLARVLDQKVMVECNEFMNKIKEARHFKTLE